MRNKLFAFILSAILALFMVGCNSEETAANGDRALVGQEESQTPDLMDEDTYLAEVQGLNYASLDFMAAVRRIMDNRVDLETTITEMKEAKEPFISFAEIDNPPKEYEEAHARLAEAGGELGTLLDRYVDLVQNIGNGSIDIDTEFREKVIKLCAEIEEITAKAEEAYKEIYEISNK